MNGNTGVWTQISVDQEAGLVYLPVETPTSDFYGGHRPGNNLFAESLVAVDLKTGQRKWHYQFVHHPIWNFDNCCASLLLDINVNGRAIKAVTQPSKQGFLYVLDRDERPTGSGRSKSARCRRPMCPARRPRRRSLSRPNRPRMRGTVW